MTEGDSIRFPSQSHETSQPVPLNLFCKFLQVFGKKRKSLCKFASLWIALNLKSPGHTCDVPVSLLSVPTGPDSCIPRLLWVPLHASTPNGAGTMPVLALARCVECFRPWQYTRAFRVCWLTVGGPVTQSTDDLGAQIRFYTVLHLFHCVYGSLAAAIPTSAGARGLINWLAHSGIRTDSGTAPSYLLHSSRL